MLSVQNLTYRIAGRTLIDSASFAVGTGQRVGLVGPNGVGKSTLFKLISGELHADGGDISLIRGARLGMVRQDLPEDATSLLDVVLNSDTERSSLLEEAETACDPDRIGYIYQRLDDIDAYQAPARASTILAGLGFDDRAQKQPISDFSGGWRMRVALACALFLQPDLLMLDEPTNHLDFEALIWLENYLLRFSKTLLLISHDRDILNKTVTHILHFDQKKLVSYTGTYDQFERRRAERLLNQQALHDKQQAQKAKMMEFVDRFRAKASKARQAQSRLKAIEKMDLVDAVIADRVTAFQFPDPDELRSPLIALDGVSAGYDPHHPVLRKLNLRIDMDDRIALLGANGNGKSTLVKLLSGRLDAFSGQIQRASKLRTGYFAQFQTEELDRTQTPFSLLKTALKDQTEPKVRAALAGFGFDRLKADTRIHELSGGEKARLLFCMMSLEAPHILFLDEPTNHLDIDAREALMQALNAYKGAVILVSHDPHLVECVADRLWLVADGTCRPYEDDLESYRDFVIRQRRQDRAGDKSEVSATVSSAGQDRSRSDLEQKISRLEQTLDALSSRKQDIELALATAFQTGTQEDIRPLQDDLARITDEQKRVEAQWAELAEAL